MPGKHNGKRSKRWLDYFVIKKGNVLQKQSFIQQEKAAFGLRERIFTENPIPNKAYSCFCVKLQIFSHYLFFAYFCYLQGPQTPKFIQGPKFSFYIPKVYAIKCVIVKF